MKSLTFISRQPPFGTSKAKACLDMVLASAVFEQQIHYVFVDDGVWQLVRGHAPDSIGAKNTMAAIPALELYGVDNVYALDESLTARGLVPADLQISVKVCSKVQLQKIISESDVVTAI